MQPLTNHFLFVISSWVANYPPPYTPPHPPSLIKDIKIADVNAAMVVIILRMRVVLLLVLAVLCLLPRAKNNGHKWKREMPARSLDPVIDYCI